MEETALAASKTMMPKISIGLIPDWPTHWADMAVATQTPRIVTTDASTPISKTTVNKNARRIIKTGAHLMGTIASPALSFFEHSAEDLFRLW